MQDSTLLKIAISAGIIGVITLFLISSQIQPHHLKHIKSHEEGETVQLTGEVQEVINAGSVTIMKIRTTQTIDVVAFDPIDIHENEYIKITGEVGVYKGEKQIVAETITK